MGAVALLWGCSLSLPGLPVPPDPTATAAVLHTAIAATAEARTPQATPTAPPAAPRVAEAATPAATAAKPAASGAGTAAPAAAGTPAQGQGGSWTPEESEYIRYVTAVFRRQKRSLGSFTELMSQPDFEDISWVISFKNELQTWKRHEHELEQAGPPASMKAVHDQAVVSQHLFAKAAGQWEAAVTSGNRAGVQLAAQTTRQAGAALGQAERELARLMQERGIA